MWFNYLWIGILLGLVGFILFFPWKQLLHLPKYIEISIATIRFYPALELNSDDSKVPSREAYIIPEICIENKTDFPLTISKLQGIAHYETIRPIHLCHELICIKPLHIKPHNRNIYKLRLPISKETAERFVKSSNIGQELSWYFEFTIGARIKILPKEYVFQCVTPKKRIVPRFTDWEDESHD